MSSVLQLVMLRLIGRFRSCQPDYSIIIFPLHLFLKVLVAFDVCLVPLFH